MEADKHLQMQLDQREKNTISKDQYNMTSYEESEVYKSTNKLLLRGLKKQAITGSIVCDLCDLKFQDVGVFDAHMEQSHFLNWRCNLCDSSFYQSSELITHKILMHNGNIIICNSCENADNQNDKWEIINEKNDKDQDKQHDQDKQEKIIEKNDLKKEVATFRVNERTATSSINIAVQTEDDKIETESSQIQLDLAEQSNTTSDSDIGRITKNCRVLLEKLKMFKHEEKEHLSCNICKIYFGVDRYFKAHNKIHEERSMTCTKCYIKCPSAYKLFLHKRAIHNMYKRVQYILKYICNKCERFFTNSWNWQSHNENKCSK